VDGRRAAGAQTRERLIAAATSLLAEEGEAGVTLRALSARSGANVAAVKYHFGSREALIVHVVDAAVAPVVDAQVAALSALAVGGEVDAWVVAWARPLIDVAVGGKPLARVIAQTLTAPSGTLDVQVRAAADRATALLLAGLRGVLPEVGDDDLRLRLALMASALAGFAGGSYAPFLAGGDLEARILDRLVRIAR
jgi:AcrR family transcriptional regulator